MEEQTIQQEQQADVFALMKQVEAGQETMQLWSDEKKTDFVKLFHDRATAARYILLRTGYEIAITGERRKFIGVRKLSEIYGKYKESNWHLGIFPSPHTSYSASVEEKEAARRVGGRLREELDEVAKARAQKIINEMPVMKDAVKTIAPEIAVKIEQRDKLLEEGQKLWNELGEYESPIYLADYADKKVSSFLEALKERTKTRKKILAKLDEVGEEGCELEEQIDRALFRGLPGLDNAIRDIILEHIERAKAMDQFDRRVEEKVKFGDSEAAVTLLHQFEKDEQSISEDVAATFKTALSKLSLAAKSGKTLKQLQKGQEKQ